MGRFPANCFVFSLFPSFFLRFFPFSLFPFFFFFFGRALSSCIGSVLLIVTALSSFVDFENENAKVAFQPSNRPLFIASHPLAGRKLAESYFHGRRRERERSDLSRNDSLECNKRARAVDEGTLLRQLWKFLLAFFEGSFVATRRRPYPSCATTSRIRLSTFSNGRIFCFESVVSRTGAFTFPLSRDEIQRRIVGYLEILGLNRCDRRPFIVVAGS